jgi:hypothetical protein
MVTLATIRSFLQLHRQAAAAAALTTQQEMQVVQAAAAAVTAQADQELQIKAEQAVAELPMVSLIDLLAAAAVHRQLE